MSTVLSGYRPLIIIGSPRSGTNMLRDVLVRLPQFGTWPCDEINYIWRHFNTRYPSDEFPPELARSEVIGYIRNQFDKRARTNQRPWLVEKTCANSLRVDFVDAVIPEARYLFIYRDGYDVVASAMKRWKAELDISYLFAKARFLPLSDLPYYMMRYFGSHLHRLYSAEKRHAFWGPRMEGMAEIMKRYSLEEVCALQWQHCIESSQASFAEMPDTRVMKVQYEQFVSNSEDELARICEFLDLSVSVPEIQAAVASVSGESVGKGRRELGEGRLLKIGSLVGDALRQYGYD